ncbi:hypothetical protein FTX61_16700 [Nitriliruptoraceae bacterium ZYF776]|nr:hypothetical protein [Profundirhabdus halotolerans]
MERWVLAAAANAIVALAYLSISIHVLRGVHATGSWRTNPLAVATGLIFLTCAAGHAGHVNHLVDPMTQDISARLYDWHLIVIDGITAVIATRYWMLRGRFPALVRGAAVFEDLSARREQALDVHDHIIQQLLTAKLALELGDRDLALTHLDAGIVEGRRIVSDLVGDDLASTATLRPGGLRRGQPS